MWKAPLPLFAGSQADIVETIDSDTYIGNLYTYLNSPAAVVDVVFTVNGADAGEIIIPTDFAAGSTFEFVAINGGRFLGEGGDAGDGGADYGGTGEAGLAGSPGTPAIYNQGTYAVSLDIDDGFLFGGGGGGGGGSYTNTGASTGDAGCGGGGGQGWSGGTFGAGGIYTGLPQSTNGANGSRLAAGSGGVNLGTGGATSDGGNGGTWGLGGRTGRSSDLKSGAGAFGTFFYYGGLGGRAGNAYRGPTPTFSGTDSEATLRAAGRILGETSPNRLNVPSFYYVSGGGTLPVNINIGVKFNELGQLVPLNTTGPETPSNSYYLIGGGTGGDYEMRVPNRSGDVDPSYWETPEAVQGTWASPSVSLIQWYDNYTGSGSKIGLFELRRSDIPGTTSTSDEIMASFYLRVSVEAEP